MKTLTVLSCYVSLWMESNLGQQLFDSCFRNIHLFYSSICYIRYYFTCFRIYAAMVCFNSPLFAEVSLFHCVAVARPRAWLTCATCSPASNHHSIVVHTRYLAYRLNPLIDNPGNTGTMFRWDASSIVLFPSSSLCRGIQQPVYSAHDLLVTHLAWFHACMKVDFM